MQSRAARLLVFLVLLASGAGAVWSGWSASRDLADLDRRQRELNDRLDRLATVLESVASAQQAYITPAPGEDPSRVLDLIGQLRTDADALRPQLRSTESGRAVQDVAAAAATLQDIETRAQEYVRGGQDFLAADLMFSEGRAAHGASGSGLRNIRSAEYEAYATARADALDRAWGIAGVVAALWVVGLLLLLRVPAASAPEPLAVAPSPPPVPPFADPPLDLPLPDGPDLLAAADICTAIGRLGSAEELPQLLQRAAAVLEASGMVVWMAAGEELFAAAAFGYPQHVIQKLGPINRSAINATAAAWRSGTLQVVSGGHDARGALAAPMLGPDRCIGVLAAEVNIGHDSDMTRRAVAMMFAAQLAAALAGWPAASAAAPADEPPLKRTAEG